jgi:hypothetical protein
VGILAVESDGGFEGKRKACQARVALLRPLDWRFPLERRITAEHEALDYQNYRQRRLVVVTAAMEAFPAKTVTDPRYSKRNVDMRKPENMEGDSEMIREMKGEVPQVSHREPQTALNERSYQPLL